MRNELQAAVAFFKERITAETPIAEGDNLPQGLVDMARHSIKLYTTALAALQDVLQRQPDPTTGLMPCGCGGKAKVWPSDLRRAMVTDYEVVCTECAMTTGWVRGKQENAMKFWNTAMGWKGGAE